jgi:putative DNA primase/helicase
MLTAEDTLKRDLVPRLMAAKADLSKVTFLDCIRTDEKERQFLLAEDLALLESAIRDIGNVGLVTIDPITAYMGGKIDSHKATQVRDQLGPLKNLAERTDVAFSTITHPAKSGGRRAIDHFIGSQAFIAAGRVGHVCTKEKDEEGNETGRRLFSVAKINAGRMEPTWAYTIEETTVFCDDGEPIITARVVWDPEPINITADQAVAAAAGFQSDDQKQKVKACGNFLVMMLSDGPKLGDEVQKKAKALDFGRKALDKACAELGIVKKPGKFQGQWEWSLATEGLLRPNPLL